MEKIAWMIPFFPCIGAIIIGCFGRNHLKEKSHTVAIGAVALSFLFSLMALFSVMSSGHALEEMILFEWIGVGNLNVSIGFLIDQLTCIMLFVVTGVGLLVHIYSSGYMHGEPGYYRYFAYINLFMFSMLILVMGSSYLLMFVGWEGVGLCSYLLIGFWFHKKSACDAGKKAFVANRVGDAGFLLGIFLIFYSTGSLDYLKVFEAAHHLDIAMATAITLCLFVGATGKSAQIPLYVWLPDAMEGPTPVSALIHAATMVTAGVYMVVRSNVLYSMAPVTSAVVATIGAMTAIFAATIALTQNDIKKVLAYSTVSQLGYMFLGCGVGAYISAVFHLMTHAFFKGLLFLGSGSVIHAMSGEQDMRKMGALRKHIPITATTFYIGTVAIAGIPPLAGFWSKDEILGETFKGGHYFLWGIGVVAALMTSFYMFRLVYMTFYGESRVEEHAMHHLHESPKSMTTPLSILAGLSIVGGIIPGWPTEAGWIHGFLGPVIAGGHGGGHGESAAHHLTSTDWVLILISVAVGVIGWVTARYFYVKRPEIPAKIAQSFKELHTLLYNKYWVDEIYEVVFIQNAKGLANFLWNFDKWIIDGLVNGAGALSIILSNISSFIDKHFVDGSVNGVSFAVDFAGGKFRILQSGKVQNYILAMVLGVCLLVIISMF